MKSSIFKDTLPTEPETTATSKNFQTPLNPLEDQITANLKTLRIRHAIRLLLNDVLSHGETAIQYNPFAEEALIDGAGI
jgi:hypothetical protein